MQTRTLVICADQQLRWDFDAEPALCDDVDHDHQRRELHVHRDPVRLPDGTEITAVSYDPRHAYDREREPDFGLYLDPRWQPPWDHDLLAWPDFGVPDDRSRVWSALQSLIQRARDGQLVEVGCLGGHGRTGTALAIAAVLTGLDPADAVDWVRSNYCPEAVETPTQESFVAGTVSE
ncbi:MAG TPA: protein-tyrosine phosphatase family protein [Microlunatus sp.]